VWILFHVSCSVYGEAAVILSTCIVSNHMSKGFIISEINSEYERAKWSNL
jgi:hypothetical protein